MMYSGPQSQGASLPLTLLIPLSELSIPNFIFSTGPLALSNKQTNQPGGADRLLKKPVFPQLLQKCPEFYENGRRISVCTDI
jgi:hypothetical protein